MAPDPLEPISANQDTVDKYFTSHTMSKEQQEASAKVRLLAKQFAFAILEACPPGKSRDAAIEHARASLMFSNASIAGGE